tara:strand:+ start:316 stop:771 length:456 start_codon:yes stop_codon:yes gene_type:complete
METWGAGSFENVVAQLWLIKLVDGTEVEPLVEALEAVQSDQESVPSAVACKAIAAAELVASLNPDSKVSLPDDISDWFKRKKLRPSQELVHLAREAMDKVAGESSQLRQHWEAQPRGGKEWVRLIEQLKTQLNYEAPRGLIGDKSWWRFWN